MQCYMQAYGVSESDLAQIAVHEYQNATYKPWPQMNKVQITLEQAVKIEGVNRYVVDGANRQQRWLFSNDRAEPKRCNAGPWVRGHSAASCWSMSRFHQ